MLALAPTSPALAPEPMTLRRILAYSIPSAALLLAAIPTALVVRRLQAAFDRSFSLSLDGLGADAEAWTQELEER